MNIRLLSKSWCLLMWCLLTWYTETNRGFAQAVTKGNAKEPENALRALQAWCQQFHTLRMEYSLRPVEETGQIAGAPGESARQYRVEWAWSKEGQWHHHMREYRGNSLVARRVAGSDGKTQFQVFYDPGVSEYHDSDRVAYHDKPIWTPSVEPLAGLWFPQDRQWLSQRLNTGKCTFAGTTPAAEGALPFWVDTAQEYFTATIVLDPQHGFLPRRFSIAANNPIPPALYWNIEEFSENQGLPLFPRSGTMATNTHIGYLEQRWHVDKWEWNQPLEPALFTPPIAQGTLVTNADGTQYVQGGVRRPQLEVMAMNHLREKLGAETREGVFPWGMRPRQSWDGTIALVIALGSFILVAVAFLLRWRHSRSKPLAASKQINGK